MAKKRKPLRKAEYISKLISAHPNTVRRYAREGKVPCFRINGLVRFDEDAVIKALKQRK